MMQLLTDKAQPLLLETEHPCVLNDATSALRDSRHRHCQVEAYQRRFGCNGAPPHAAVVAVRHCAAASDRKMRSVDRETRWRWRLKVLWMAACTLRNRCADAADLKRCILRSRRRTT